VPAPDIGLLVRAYVQVRTAVCEDDDSIELERSVSEKLEDCSSLDDEINPVALGAFSEQAEKIRTMLSKVE
jgi:hypothetical protein